MFILKAALGYEECCMLILKSNSESAFQKVLNGLLPIHYAVMAGHANLINMFFEYYEGQLSPKTDAVSAVTTHPKIALSEKLIDKDGFSLLHYACFNGHSTCAETLCELGNIYSFLTEMLATDSHNKLACYNKFSPLHGACKNSHDACVSFILERFAAHMPQLIETEDSQGNRPLHICAIANEYDSALLLLEANCGLNYTNKQGKTPLMLAASHNSFSILELLMSSDNKSSVKYYNKKSEPMINVKCKFKEKSASELELVFRQGALKMTNFCF